MERRDERCIESMCERLKARQIRVVFQKKCYILAYVYVANEFKPDSGLGESLKIFSPQN